MMREYHVRICEGLGVKFPGSTRQFRPIDAVRGMSVIPLIAAELLHYGKRRESLQATSAVWKHRYDRERDRVDQRVESNSTSTQAHSLVRCARAAHSLIIIRRGYLAREIQTASERLRILGGCRAAILRVRVASVCHVSPRLTAQPRSRPQAGA